MKFAARPFLVGLAFLGILALAVFGPFSRLAVSVAFFVLCGAVLAAKAIWPKAFEAPKTRTEIDVLGVRRLRSSEVIERIAWTELVSVKILTTDAGPYGEDFFWLLASEDGTGCAVPNDEAVASGLFEWLSRLPAFDHDAVIRASGVTIPAMFDCWSGAKGKGVVVDASGA